MRSKRIYDAYESIGPEDGTFDAILQGIEEKAGETTQVRRNPFRQVVLVAACLGLIAAISGVGYAAYQKWRLPVPESYEPGEMGNLNIHSETDYTGEVVGNPEDAKPLTDEYFISKAVEILSSVGLTEVDTDAMTVSRQEHMYWDREEAEVYFVEAEPATRVTFDGDTGQFLNLTGIEWSEEAGQACETKEEAEALAKEYYELLPVAQGYVLQSCTEYDEQYWSYDFCREVLEGIYSSYECVRIGLNPKTGKLNLCNVFYTPLLDDHEPGDEPLTQAEAEAIALNCEHVNLGKYTLQEADVNVVLPNWAFTEYAGINNKASKVTRLSWVLTYENTDSEFADIVTINIDYYTGEILGGDMT